MIKLQFESCCRTCSRIWGQSQKELAWSFFRKWAGNLVKLSARGEKVMWNPLQWLSKLTGGVWSHKAMRRQVASAYKLLMFKVCHMHFMYLMNPWQLFCINYCFNNCCQVKLDSKYSCWLDFGAGFVCFPATLPLGSPYHIISASCFSLEIFNFLNTC